MVVGVIVLVVLCFTLGYFLRWFIEPKPCYVGDLIIVKLKDEPLYTYLEMNEEGILEDLRNGQTVYFLVRSKNNRLYDEKIINNK